MAVLMIIARMSSIHGASLMQIIGDRHYRATAGESITVALGPTSHVGSTAASLDNAPATALPVTVAGGGHHKVVVTAAFVGHNGGSAEILVTGSAGGNDTSRLRQLSSLPFRSAIFIFD